jgi:hypothetical protein
MIEGTTMSKEAESADLIMKLYDLRREATMREARNWYIVSFFPESAQDIINVLVAPETSAYFRMVTSYWDMAAGFVNRGAIDEDMFHDSAGECLVVFSKVEPYIEEVRTIVANPKMLASLEALIRRIPNVEAILAERREMIKRMVAARSEMSKSA